MLRAAHPARMPEQEKGIERATECSMLEHRDSHLIIFFLI